MASASKKADKAAGTYGEGFKTMLIGGGIFLVASLFDSGKFMAVSGLLFAVGLFSVLFKSTVQVSAPLIDAIDLRLSPTHITPIQPESDTFNVSRLVPPPEPLPTLKGEWKSISSDQQLLKTYADYLDKHRQSLDAVTQLAINRYIQDREVLLDQQKQVMRHAFQANQLLSRFTDLPPPASLSVNDLPEINTISIPPAPPYLTPEQYAKKCNIAPAVANMTITRVVNNWNGSAANIITLALAVVQLAVRTKAMVSEGIRAMEEARGQIGIIAAEARTQVSLLEEAHKQVVSISNNMQSAANAINELLVQAKQLPGNITTLSQLSENQRHTIKELHRWRRIAETFSNATVR